MCLLTQRSVISLPPRINKSTLNYCIKFDTVRQDYNRGKEALLFPSRQNSVNFFVGFALFYLDASKKYGSFRFPKDYIRYPSNEILSH